MVGNNQRNLAVEFAALLTVEQILQAMVTLRDEDSDARTVRRSRQPLVHLEVASDGRKVLGEFEVKSKLCRIELHPRKKKVGLLVALLVIEQDVAVVAKDEIGNRGNHPFAVATRHRNDGGVVLKNKCSASVLAGYSGHRHFGRCNFGRKTGSATF